MKPQSFSIENVFFEVDALNSLDNFIVKSMLDDYRVTWCSKHAPLENVRALLLHTETLLVIDQTVLEYFGHGIEWDASKMYVVNATEHVKTLEGVIALFDFLSAKKANKATKVLAVGGGIVQELVAFASKCYQRGIDWIFFPTTLLAMSDSCIGGKSSLNYKGIKNQLGLFCTPSEIFININFLNLLPLRDLRSGLGEILKICILVGEESLFLYKNLIADAMERNPVALKHLLSLALTAKKAIVEADEFDKYERRALNYGHTIGHIIESLTDFQVPHGLAIVAGIIFANRFSVARGMLSESKACELDEFCFDLLNHDILERIAALKPEKMVTLLDSDKKSHNNKLQFVLLEQPSMVKFVALDLQTEKADILQIIALALQIISNRIFPKVSNRVKIIKNH